MRLGQLLNDGSFAVKPSSTPHYAYDGGPRDEFSCPCCRVPTDGHECDACRAAECGEQDDEQYAKHGCLKGGLVKAATEVAQANLRAVQLEAEVDELRDELAALRSRLNSAADVAEEERATRMHLASCVTAMAERAADAARGSGLECQLKASSVLLELQQFARMYRHLRFAVVHETTPGERAEAAERGGAW